MVIELWKPGTVLEVINTLEVLGFVNIVVRGISSFKYLLTWESVEKLKEVDMEMLSLGFLNCKQATWRDIVPCRKATLECVGLPWVCWNLKNLSRMLQEWGNICAISSPFDNEMTFSNPIVTIDTLRPRDLSKCITVKFQGETLKVHFNEIHDVSVEDVYDQYLFTESEDQSDKNSTTSAGDISSSMEGTESAVSKRNEVVSKSRDATEDNIVSHYHLADDSPLEGNNTPFQENNATNEVDKGASLIDDKVVGLSVEVLGTPTVGEAGEVVNEPLQEPCLKKSDTGKDSNVKWLMREDKSSSFLLSSKSSLLKGSSVRNSQNEDRISMSSIVNNVNKLKLGRKRGRPTKKSGRKSVKSFAIKFKGKNDICQELPANIEKESAKVLESCLLMGLGLEMCNTDALACIKERLTQ